MPDPKILVIAPHADDEVIGCGGMIARRSSEGAAVDVVVCGVGGLKHRHLDAEATLSQRMDELHLATEILGVRHVSVLFEGMDMRLDTLPRVEIVSKLDDILEAGYDQVFIPEPGYNHDHQTISQCARSSLRNKGNGKLPRLTVMYESPQSDWAPATSQDGKMFTDITGFLEVKLEALAAYKSQVRPHPHQRSAESLRIRAASRGFESGVEHAELAYVQRLIT